jgi:glycerol-3-phosphate acyltransferase PlsY
MMSLGIVLSYLLGSIPTAYIFGKLSKGIDIREHGSGNVGATNVFRVLGKVPGIVCLLLDVLKGVLAVVIVPRFLGLEGVLEHAVFGFFAVIGHNWTIFLKFKGGKGVATSLGILIGLTIEFPPICIVLLFTLLVWVICFFITAIISTSSIIAGFALPLLMVITDQSFEMVCLGIIFCVFITVRHRPNIKRILAGQEPQVPLPFRSKKS